jgi:hypothetical protein
VIGLIILIFVGFFFYDRLKSKGKPANKPGGGPKVWLLILLTGILFHYTSSLHAVFQHYDGLAGHYGENHSCCLTPTVVLASNLEIASPLEFEFGLDQSRALQLVITLKQEAIRAPPEISNS